ncbi:hypothetical protein M2272_004015 [Mycobacterium frederiksbergense]|uniref:Uncharacterized protein n=1 Tax=Mycolicibacterium frederiksbergense TaxID=117567 RepID=A0ABT6L339_9MYCO|nr:hypothetical protein [Mycolicibacterium frederiksbergense]
MWRLLPEPNAELAIPGAAYRLLVPASLGVDLTSIAGKESDYMPRHGMVVALLAARIIHARSARVTH